MGRGKIEIKRIENSTNRQVTYSKRMKGIVKKATEISVLCDAKVSVVIFSNNDKMHAYHTPSSSMEDILESYQNFSGKRIWDAKHENLKNEIDRIKKENDDMKIELKHLNGEDIGSLQYPDLERLEDALDNGLTRIKNKEMEIYDLYQKNTRMLEEENNHLTYIWHRQGMLDGSGREMEGVVVRNSNPLEREYQHCHMPYSSYRVQPMQPNLQDRV